MKKMPKPEYKLARGQYVKTQRPAPQGEVAISDACRPVDWRRGADSNFILHQRATLPAVRFHGDACIQACVLPDLAYRMGICTSEIAVLILPEPADRSCAYPD